MKYYYLKRHRGIFRYFQHSQTKYGYRLRTYHNHQQHEKSKRGFTSLKDAIDALNKVKVFKIGSKSTILVKDWCHHYLNVFKPPTRKITTYTSYKSLLENNVLPIVGNYQLSQLKLDDYQENVINHLIRQGLSRRTVSETNARFQAVINYAVKSGCLNSNPVRFATVPNKNIKPRKVIMNDKELKMFNQTLKKHSITFQVIFFTLEDTGMRIGELLGLRWIDIDLRSHIISINHTRDVYGLRSPKTPHSKRKIQITDRLNDLLSKYAIFCKKHFGLNQSSYVIKGKRGNKLEPNRTSVILRKLLKESNLSNLLNRFTPHSFRHQFASRLIDNGVSPIFTAKVLGHSSPAITLQIYAQAKNGVIPNLQKIMNNKDIN